VEIINRYDHINLDHLRCHWSLVGEGFRKKGKEVKIPNGIFAPLPLQKKLLTHRAVNPHETATLEISDLTFPMRECYLELSFTLRSPTNWAPANFELAFGQIRLVPPTPFPLLKQLSPTSTAPTITQLSAQILEIATHGSTTAWKFNIIHGALISWSKSGNELIHTPPFLDFYRAVTDNDAGERFGQSWRNSRLYQTKCHATSVSWSNTPNDGKVEIVVQARIAPPVLEWSVDTTFTYTFTSSQLSIKVVGVPRGNYLPNSFARIGLTLALNDVDKAAWFGRGPGESYRDKKLSQRFGTYEVPIEDLFVNYDFPQETSNRTDVRWVEFLTKGKKGPSLKAHFGPLAEASFTALHYTTEALDKAQHPYELYKNKKEETIVRLDWAHHGLGTGSCGPATLPEYELHCAPFAYEILLE
jgi:beta-galactosidase